MTSRLSSGLEDVVDDLAAISQSDVSDTMHGELLNFRNQPFDETDAATQFVELAVRLETGEVTKVIATKNHFYSTLKHHGFSVEDVQALDASATTISLPVVRTSLGTELATQTQPTLNWSLYLGFTLAGSGFFVLLWFLSSLALIGLSLLSLFLGVSTVSYAVLRGQFR
jgi:hypothetical protein